MLSVIVMDRFDLLHFCQAEYLPLFFSRRLYVFLSMLVNGEEDDKSEDVIKEKENISTIVSILETIKLSEDSVDTTKSKVRELGD